MSKTRIASVIKDNLGVPEETARNVATNILTMIQKTLRKEGSFSIPSFGTLVVRKMAARTIVNPSTRQKMKVKARKTVRFRASKQLRAAIASPRA